MSEKIIFFASLVFSTVYVLNEAVHIIFNLYNSGADPGFLERGFICIKVWGSLCCFYLIFLKYSMKMK